MRVAIFSALVCLGSMAQAQTPLDAAGFDAYTQGRTLYFFNNGTAYGVERYLPGNRVLWSFLDGDCKDGIWYQQGSMICFEYDGTPNPQCWEFYQESNGLRAVFEGETSNTILYEATDASDEMLCYGPDVGV